MAASGYNFVGYNNPDYDAIAEAQRAELDLDVRQGLLFQAQEMIANDVPNVYFAHPSTPQLVRTDVWDIDTVVTQAGIGIHNFWTWTGLTPIGDQDTIITSTTSFLEAFNPLYIAGDAPSRVTELIWDRSDADRARWPAASLGRRKRRLGKRYIGCHHLARGHELA